MKFARLVLAGICVGVAGSAGAQTCPTPDVVLTIDQPTPWMGAPAPVPFPPTILPPIPAGTPDVPIDDTTNAIDLPPDMSNCTPPPC